MTHRDASPMPGSANRNMRSRVMSMYQKYQPDKLAGVDSLMAKAAGQEELSAPRNAKPWAFLVLSYEMTKTRRSAEENQCRGIVDPRPAVCARRTLSSLTKKKLLDHIFFRQEKKMPPI